MTISEQDSGKETDNKTEDCQYFDVTVCKVKEKKLD